MIPINAFQSTLSQIRKLISSMKLFIDDTKFIFIHENVIINFDDVSFPSLLHIQESKIAAMSVLREYAFPYPINCNRCIIIHIRPPVPPQPTSHPQIVPMNVISQQMTSVWSQSYPQPSLYAPSNSSQQPLPSKPLSVNPPDEPIPDGAQIDSSSGALLPANIPNIVENPIDNRDYWNRYYQDGLCPMDPSPFARYAATLVEPGRTLVDLGCGNGRDALYFASLGLSVIAIDLSDTAIQTLRERGGDNPRFLCGDFINAPIHRPASYDYAYSRFTIHAINQQQERMLLLAMHRAIKPGGKFFIEVRGVHDPLYGRGQPQEKNAFFYNNHYRRFIVMEELTASLQEAGFRVEYAQERTGFAPYGNDDPPVIRIVAIRKEMKA